MQRPEVDEFELIIADAPGPGARPGFDESHDVPGSGPLAYVTDHLAARHHRPEPT